MVLNMCVRNRALRLVNKGTTRTRAFKNLKENILTKMQGLSMPYMLKNEESYELTTVAMDLYLK